MLQPEDILKTELVKVSKLRLWITPHIVLNDTNSVIVLNNCACL